ncbi:MAG: pyruvoyl-dependent arginine decarboxylase [Candidatus Aenigmarchaeota archaeon]|nr:pyruvoyl-dependent arginine decarboxylase [Candidatus Aenigmarchaeota archaeon]
MKIHITRGTGEGPTREAAFDKALWDAGISNYNLIRLSSILPENSEIAEGRIDWNHKNIGHRLYVVLAEGFETEPGKELWVGIGWIIAKDGTGVVEYVSGNSEEYVLEHVEKTLRSDASPRNKEFEYHYRTISVLCRDFPVSAVIAMVYKSEGWND